MLLAGVVMKLGAYGCLRVAMTLFPMGMQDWASHHFGFGSWREVFGLLAVIGIVYGAMVALVQKDFKFVIGYSSVSHMGFVLLGLMTLSVVGLSGAVLQMFSHGVIAGLLFAVVGRMVYDRTHTRQLEELHQMNLSRLLPFAAVTFTLASVASMGLPGFSGFVAELQVLIGAWQAWPSIAVIAGCGVVIGVAYTLRALQLAFFADHDAHLVPEPAGNPGHDKFDPISVPERFATMLLIGASLVIGLFPRLLLDLINEGMSSPIFDALRKGGPGWLQ
jgi:NADH-quinone oxidoreductase subunit M